MRVDIYGFDVFRYADATLKTPVFKTLDKSDGMNNFAEVLGNSGVVFTLNFFQSVIMGKFIQNPGI